MRRKMLLFFCTALLLLALAGCGKEKYSDSKYVGKWKAVNAEYVGVNLDPEAVLGGEFSLTLAEDGTASLKIVDKKSEGTWEEAEKGIKVKSKKDKFEMTDAKDNLTLEYQGLKLTFEKDK